MTRAVAARIPAVAKTMPTRPASGMRAARAAMLGDPTLFARHDFVESSWGLITPIHKAWEAAGLPVVMAEGMILKAPKVMKHVEKLKLQGWDFLNQFLKKGKGDDAQVDSDGRPMIVPKNQYVKDLIAGRPVFVPRQ